MSSQIKILRKKPKTKKIIQILKAVFYEKYPNSEQWYLEQIKSVDYSKSYFFYINQKLVGIYLMKEEPAPGNVMQGLGIKGEALAILPRYQKKGIFTKVLAKLKKSKYDYFWGMQGKKLNNLNFWLKYREIIGETPEDYITAAYLK